LRTGRFDKLRTGMGPFDFAQDRRDSIAQEIDGWSISFLVEYEHGGDDRLRPTWCRARSCHSAWCGSLKIFSGPCELL
ncbi:MAG: hypothetical protein ACREUQ_15195, partial [Burkholderiales bacterium]